MIPFLIHRMTQSLIRFFILFFWILIVTYFVHLWIINYFSIKSNIQVFNLSYIFNGITAFVLILVIILAKRRFKDQLGFIFLAGSFIKLGVFVAISSWNGIEMNRSVFLDFFIAYVICMLFEVYYVSKILKTIN